MSNLVLVSDFLLPVKSDMLCSHAPFALLVYEKLENSVNLQNQRGELRMLLLTDHVSSDIRKSLNEQRIV